MVFAQTDGALSVSVKTSDTGGNFKPRNVVAIWVEDNSGEFVKTLLAYANKRKGYLTHWKETTTNAGSAYNTTDAVSGATQSSHGTRECSWDGTNFQGDSVADGSYKICMELTDKNSTGNYSTFEIIKDTETKSLTPDDVPSFSNIQIEWLPSQTAAGLIQEYDGLLVYPSPTVGPLEIKGKDIQTVEITNVEGKLFYKGSATSLDISGFSKGTYLVKIATSEYAVVRRVVKQ